MIIHCSITRPVDATAKISTSIEADNHAGGQCRFLSVFNDAIPKFMKNRGKQIPKSGSGSASRTTALLYAIIRGDGLDLEQATSSICQSKLQENNQRSQRDGTKCKILDQFHCVSFNTLFPEYAPFSKTMTAQRLQTNT
ncbi:unnamed protein product [Dovyalis caffra]|uniref:Uncharacterized protein n=1 Tax=Dovyalis caffra TaxID=77055 RepID=A0AAV1R287_9ROSI|nr:unnamed protein product [Dovyalis caffra]